MYKYTIYCTAEQTKKALELGAPISEVMSRYNARMALQRIERGLETYEDYANKGIALVDCKFVKKALMIPTEEQMLGWLEEQDILIDINPINGLHFYWMLSTKELDEGSGRYMWECQYTTPERDLEYNSIKEATLAAIDVALEYLSNNNK